MKQSIPFLISLLAAEIQVVGTTNLELPAEAAKILESK
jgi:hypothetical protein